MLNLGMSGANPEAGKTPDFDPERVELYCEG